MQLNSSWVPDEDAQTLFSERCWLQGVVVSATAYGITLCLYILSFNLLMRDVKRVGLRKQLPLLIYITISILSGTLFMIALAAFTQMSFIDNREYPGGPNGFENNMFAVPVNYMGSFMFVFSNWLSDVLVVWRFKVIYQSCRVPLFVAMFFPCLMLAGSAGIGIMWLIQASTISPYVAGTDFTLPFFSLSLALNIILTIAIVLRLLTIRYRVVSVLGPRHKTPYTSIAAMIIESAALYSVVSIMFLVLFGNKSPVSQVLFESLNQFQTIATLLIVFRVAQGKGWTEETATTHVKSLASRRWEQVELPSIRFASASAGDSLMLTSAGTTTIKDAGEDFEHVSPA